GVGRLAAPAQKTRQRLVVARAVVARAVVARARRRLLWGALLRSGERYPADRRRALQRCAQLVGHPYPAADPIALSLGPGDLLGVQHQAGRVLLGDEDGAAVVVAGQRPEAVQDLVEQVVGAQLADRLVLDLIDHVVDAPLFAQRRLVRHLATEPGQEAPLSRLERPLAAAPRH